MQATLAFNLHIPGSYASPPAVSTKKAHEPRSSRPGYPSYNQMWLNLSGAPKLTALPCTQSRTGARPTLDDLSPDDSFAAFVSRPAPPLVALPVRPADSARIPAGAEHETAGADGRPGHSTGQPRSSHRRPSRSSRKAQASYDSGVAELSRRPSGRRAHGLRLRRRHHADSAVSISRATPTSPTSSSACSAPSTRWSLPR